MQGHGLAVAYWSLGYVIHGMLCVTFFSVIGRVDILSEDVLVGNVRKNVICPGRRGPLLW